jgi:hypothetical protein
MSSAEKKVYDYVPERVRDQLVDVFKKRSGAATTADLVAITGLPKHQVETEVKAVSDEYGARLKVTESGEILYSFPSGMKSRYRGLGPSLKRFWKAFKKGAAAVASWLFKVWIVVMLVGYFVLFLALALLALLASVAMQASGKSDSRDDRRGGGLGGMMIAGRVFETIINIWFYSELFKTDEERYYRAQKRRNKRPLHKAIFSFVFGDGDPDAGWDSVEKKAVLAFLQSNKGVMTMPEFLTITGLPTLEAEERINSYLFEFGGSPEVSEAGVIYYSFPELLRRKDKADRSFGFSVPMKRIAPFSSNPKKANFWFCAINAVNILFGSYYLWGALTISTPLVNRFFDYMAANHVPLSAVGGQTAFAYLYAFTNKLAQAFLGVADPTALLAGVLGVVPLAFSVFFYGIPAIRSLRLKARNEKAKYENLRRVAYRAVLDSPAAVRSDAIRPTDDAAKPKDAEAPERLVKEIAAWSGAEPKADGSYAFDEIERSKVEAAKIRSGINLKDFELGGEVFDSGSP